MTFVRLELLNYSHWGKTGGHSGHRTQQRHLHSLLLRIIFADRSFLHFSCNECSSCPRLSANVTQVFWCKYRRYLAAVMCLSGKKHLTRLVHERGGGFWAGVESPLGARGHITIQKPVCWVTFPCAPPLPGGLQSHWHCHKCRPNKAHMHNTDTCARHVHRDRKLYSDVNYFHPRSVNHRGQLWSKTNTTIRSIAFIMHTKGKGVQVDLDLKPNILSLPAVFHTNQLLLSPPPLNPLQRMAVVI